MKFRDATASDLQQLIEYIDSNEFLASAVESDLSDWIHDTEGAAHINHYETVGVILEHFSDMARRVSVPLIPGIPL